MYQSQTHQKLIQRHVWEECVEEANHLRHHEDIQPIYKKRKGVSHSQKSDLWDSSFFVFLCNFFTKLSIL